MVTTENGLDKEALGDMELDRVQTYTRIVRRDGAFNMDLAAELTDGVVFSATPSGELFENEGNEEIVPEGFVGVNILFNNALRQIEWDETLTKISTFARSRHIVWGDSPEETWVNPRC